ncbi:MAG TPA: MmcQ/YjbR family DNA-binding protein [Gammaproteobacteria bacterium]|nr:MmcQ/YjbR family DNA-binding protein [Gammaproteobacteria bacterium]
MPAKRMDFAAVREIALALPDVADATTGRGPAFKARGKLLTCAAIHSSAEEGSLAVRIDPQLRAELLTAEPDVYYVTSHYEPYPMVLVRLARIRRAALRKLLETAWVFVTAKPSKRRPR